MKPHTYCVCRLDAKAEETTILYCSLYKKYALQTGWHMHFVPSKGTDSSRRRDLAGKSGKNNQIVNFNIQNNCLPITPHVMSQQAVDMCCDRKWGSTWLSVKAIDSKCGLAQLTWILSDLHHSLSSFIQRRKNKRPILLFCLRLFSGMTQSTVIGLWKVHRKGWESPKSGFFLRYECECFFSMLFLFFFFFLFIQWQTYIQSHWLCRWTSVFFLEQVEITHTTFLFLFHAGLWLWPGLLKILQNEKGKENTLKLSLEEQQHWWSKYTETILFCPIHHLPTHFRCLRKNNKNNMTILVSCSGILDPSGWTDWVRKWLSEMLLYLTKSDVC